MKLRDAWPNVILATAATAAVFVSFAGCKPQGPELRVAKCSGCRIDIRVVATLGQPSDSVLATLFTRVAQLGASRYAVGPMSEHGTLAIYRADGTLERVIGRLGGGPAEFQRYFGPLIETPSGSVVVVDNGNNRLTEVDSTAHIGAYGTPPNAIHAGMALPDGRLVVTGQGYAAERRQWAIHIVERPGRIVRSFSEVPPNIDRREPTARSIVALSRDAHIWFASVDKYELTLADSLGNVSAVIAHPFPAEPPDASGMGPYWVTSIHEDTSGYLWVVSGHRSTTPVAGKREQPLTAITHAALAAGLTSTIDVIDPSKRTVIYSQTFNAPPFRILRNGLGWRYVEDANGNPRIELISLELRRN